MIDEHEVARARERTVQHESVSFTDAEMVIWCVVERDARHDPGHRGDSCLIFSSTNVVRRVWHYPPDWSELTAGELEALSWLP